MIISAQLISKGNTEGVPGWGVALSLGWSWLAEVVRNGMCMFLVLVPADAVTPAETEDGVPVAFEPQFEHINQQTTEGAEDRAARHRKEQEEIRKRHEKEQKELQERHQKDEETAIQELMAKQKAERDKLEERYPAISKAQKAGIVKLVHKVEKKNLIATQRIIERYYEEGQGAQERKTLQRKQQIERNRLNQYRQELNDLNLKHLHQKVALRATFLSPHCADKLDSQ